MIDGRIGMKTVISVASAFACVFSLDAQITASLNRLPGGMDELRIRNNSSTSLVVFAVAAKRAPSGPASLGELLRNSGRTADAAVRNPFVVYYDPLIEPAAKVLLASEERV